MNRKLPPEAFDHYLELGVDRSYQAVAERYGVSKVAVVQRAKRDRWQERLRELEKKAREQADKKAVETLEAVRERQLKAARIVQARALEAMRILPPERAIKAAAALQIAWKHELLLLGEPTERTANMEEVVRREYERWMGSEEADVPEGADDGHGEEAGDQQAGAVR